MEIRKGIVGALLAVGLVFGAQGTALADTTVQNQNDSEDSTAVSGDAEAHNESETHSGPSSESAFGDSNSQQIGDNSSETHQESEAESGDAVAGSQVTAASDSDGDTTVQNQNNSSGAVAVSGNASASNSASVQSGPEASSAFGNASTSQIGSNETLLGQVSSSETGDAVSGSQVTGVL